MRKSIAALSFIVLILSVSLGNFGLGYWFRASYAGPWYTMADKDTSSCADGKCSGHGAAAPKECPKSNADNLRWQVYSHMGQLIRTADTGRDRANRKKIISFLLDRRNTGCTLTEIAMKLDMNPGTLDYYLGDFEYYHMTHSNAARSYDPECRHLMFVENSKEYRYIRLQEGKYTRIWPADLKDKQRLRILIMHMRDPVRKEILASIGRQPGITNIMLSRLFHRNKSTMHHYLKQFSDEEIIDVIQEGRTKRCFVNEDVRDMLST
jgi:DNA-binding transcriptional ArsR family regulator